MYKNKVETLILECKIFLVASIIVVCIDIVFIYIEILHQECCIRNKF